ncbi:hypothetical protein [Stenotrophomonas cyclobalanopsidis]|uniref:hypothetical protein n=1 Tax=Stenotrophomonas cyclobalanopsidis TaxID=2771362 RepID=UPI00345F8538
MLDCFSRGAAEHGSALQGSGKHPGICSTLHLDPGCFHDGRLLVRCTGDIIALSPPLIVDKVQIDQITGTLGEMIRATA